MRWRILSPAQQEQIKHDLAAPWTPACQCNLFGRQGVRRRQLINSNGLWQLKTSCFVGGWRPPGRQEINSTGCMLRLNVLLIMCQFLGDEALQSTRKHTACTNGVKTNDHDLWTTEFSMMPREKGFFLIIVKMIPISLRSIRRGENFSPFGHSRLALERNVNPTNKLHD
jgi:hypothetical protein